jgi:catechol 2,3-dioxygenase-like lactoylglutathione lyase family enzyme
MDVLSSRVLLHPTDPERSRVFYPDTLGLAIYREFGSGPDRGTVFFLGGGFLELSGRAAAPPAPGVALWLQVRELAAVRQELGERGVPILRAPRREPWGLLEMWIVTPMGCASASWRCRRSIRCAAADAHLRLLHVLPQWRVRFPGGPLRPAGGDGRLALRPPDTPAIRGKGGSPG